MASDLACRAFVFGISGATWDVAKPLLSAGRLPNLQRLIETGTSGTMLSVRAAGDKHYRPQIAWVTMATGCLPAVHGVSAFYCTATDCLRSSFWETFHANGRSVGLFYWPITWPPPALNGFVIPCYDARDTATWPPKLAYVKRIDRSQYGSTAGPRQRLAWLSEVASALLRSGLPFESLSVLTASCWRMLTAVPQVRSLALRHAKQEISAALFRTLYRRWKPDLATFHTFLVDSVSHRYWRYRNGGLLGNDRTDRRLATAVDEAYTQTDRILGQILTELPSNTVVAVVSEHGMAPEPDSNEVGPWQYLIRGEELLVLTGLTRSLVCRPVARWLSFRPCDGQKLPADALSRFRAVRIVETGLPLFHVYEHGCDEIVVKFSISRTVPRYAGGDLESLHVEYERRCAPFATLARRVGPVRSAMHDERGILVISGPGIRGAATIADCSIVDFAPTLLAAVGLKPPAGVDGCVLNVFFPAHQQTEE